MGEATSWTCPKCGAEVGRRAMLCPNCREPLTGANAPVPTPDKPKAPPLVETPPREETPAPLSPPRRGKLVTLLEDEPPAPPIGRPVTKKDAAGLLQTVVDQAQTMWKSRGKSASQRRLLWITGTCAAIGMILLVRMLIVRPWALHGRSEPVSEPVSLLSPTPTPTAASIAPAPAGTPAPGQTDQGPPQSERWAAILTRAADQIERLSDFLKSAKPDVPLRDPVRPQDVLPPIPRNEIPGPNASAEEKAYYREALRRRDRQALEAGGNLVQARQEGITMEQAREVARLLREKAASLRGEKSKIPSAQGPAAPPPTRLSTVEIDKAILTLLGQKDGEEVRRIREAR